MSLPALAALAMAFAAASIAEASAQTGGAETGGGEAFALVVTGVTAVAALLALASIRTALANSDWSLSDALSEEADVTLLDGGGKPLVDGDGKPQIASEMRASSSRLIALIGLVGILALYLGFGLVGLETFASKGSFPADSVAPITKYMLAGMTMFAPYVVNKFASVFDWMTPTKK